MGVRGSGTLFPTLHPKSWLVLITQPWEALVFVRLPQDGVPGCSRMEAPVPVGDPEPTVIYIQKLYSA